MDKDELALNPTNIEKTPEYIDMEKLALSAPLEFIGKYKTPRDWVLEQEVAERLKAVSEPFNVKEDAQTKAELGITSAARDIINTPSQLAQLGLGLTSGVGRRIFPHSTDTALDRLYKDFATANYEKDTEWNEMLQSRVGDSDITDWTRNIIQLGFMLGTAGVGAGIGANIARKTASELAKNTAKGIAARTATKSRLMSIAEAQGARTGGRLATIGTTFALEGGGAATDKVAQYIAQTGDTELKYYEPTEDSLTAIGVGAINAAIEVAFGVERFIPEFWGTSRNFGRAARRFLESAVGEGLEEGLQSIVSQYGDILNGYRNNIDFNDVLDNAIMGAVLGGAAGFGLYHLNRAHLISRVSADYNMPYRDAAKLVDNILSVGVEQTTNELSARTELMSSQGNAWEKLVIGVKTAMASVGFGTEENREQMATTWAKTNAKTAIQLAQIFGISTDEFLDIAEFGVMNNGQNQDVLFIKPLGTESDIQNRIDRIDIEINKQKDLISGGDKKLISDLRTQKKILQKALAIKKFNSEQMKADLDKQTTPELKQEIDTATKDADKAVSLESIQTANPQASTTETNKRFGNAVIKKLFGKDKTGFQAVMVTPQAVNAKNAIIAVADRINNFIKAHRTYGLKKDLVNALNKLQTVTQENFIDNITEPLLDGTDVTAENAFLYHFLFSDANTISVFLDSYITRAEQSLAGETAPLSKKDITFQAFKATDSAMQQQAQSVGAEYTSIYDASGNTIIDKNVLAVLLSYQNQFVQAQPTQLTLFQEYFDLADENARLDDIYPAYTGETIEVDGKERTVYDSNGKRIAKSKEALTNFWRWFGDSKVVDKQGRPLVVYHGTPSGDFNTFYTESYFTPNKEYADSYQHPSMSATWTGKKTSAPTTFAVYLKIEKTFTTTDSTAKNIFQKEYTASYSPDLAEDGNVDWVEAQDLIPYLMDNHPEYDGIILSEGGERGVSYVPFDGLRYRQKFNQTSTALQEIANGAEESTVKNLRDDLSQYGGTNDVTFVFGDKKKGIAHIVDSHGIDILPQVFDTVIDGKIQRYVAGNKTVILEKDGYEAVLSLDEHGKTKTGLLSGWKISTGETSEVSATSSPTQDRPTFSRSELGAVLDTMSMTQPYKNVNSQIKSVDNRGTYRVDTGNIYYQTSIKQGMYDPELGVIVLGRDMNEVTLPHEMAHYWLDTIFNIYKRAQAGELSISDEGKKFTKELFDMLGIDENQAKLTKGQQEKFARMTELYLTGLDSVAKENTVFKAYFDWVPEKYKSILNLGYLDDQGKIQYPVLDNAAVEFFNKWYGNYALPSLSTSPEKQRFVNPTDAQGEIIPTSIKEMNDRNKEFAQDSEEQVKTDERLYNTLDENMPSDIKIAADGQRIVIAERSNFLKNSENQQRGWYERKSRDKEAQLAQDYIEKNPEHAKEVIFGDPELVPNDTGVDRATLINAYMALNKITPDNEEWAILHTNIAINQSLAGTQLALSNDKSYRVYLDALREIERVREEKIAINYAGISRNATLKLNKDIQSFLDKELPAIFATKPNTKEREIALKTLFEKARTKFSGNTTGKFLYQEDINFAKAQKGNSAAFTRWAINQIKKGIGAKLSTQEQAKLLEISAKAQQAFIDLNNSDAGKSVAAAQEVRKWQVEIDKLTGVKHGFSLFGDYAPRAMLASFNTLVVANPPSTAINTVITRMISSSVFGENNVSESLIKNEIMRIKAIYGATAMNLAQMEKPTSPTLLHGEKYSTSGQKWYDPFTILGKEDNFFRVPTFVNTLARIASTDAKATGRNADEVFKEYCRLDNDSDAAKLARKQALAVGNIAVFTQDGVIASVLNHIRSELNRGSRMLFGLSPEGFGLGNLLAPFLKTGANITEMGLRGVSAPIITAVMAIQAQRTGKKLDAMQKLALGMDWTLFLLTVLGVALLAALEDDDFYTDPYEVGKKYEPDKPYDSIKLDGVWVDVEFFGPFALPLRTASKAVQSWRKDKNIAGSVAVGYGAGAKSALSDTPLVEAFYNNQVGYATRKPLDWFASFAYNQLNKFIPAEAKPISRAVSRESGVIWNTDWAGKVISRKFHRNYGFDGAEPTTQDWVDVLSTKFTLD